MRPQDWQYLIASPCVEYRGGGTAECFPGRDQESIHDIVVKHTPNRGLKGNSKDEDEDIVLLELKDNVKNLGLLLGSFHRQLKEVCPT